MSSTLFGPYELRSLIGRGGTGEVYRAYDTEKGRMVALKQLRPEFAADPAFQQRFRYECRLWARLQEPHALPVHDFGQIQGVLFIDMELVDGGTLRDLIRQRGALDPAQAASIIGQLASALDASHGVGLVHRDVRPENVLLTSENFAYLVDFGIESIDGPVGYRAPELLGGGRVGPPADVYSLTCVLYECLTGQPPFDSSEGVDAHLFSVPPRPSIMRRGIDRTFDGIIATGMAKQPGARFASAGELAREVFTAAKSGLAPAPVAAPVAPAPSSTRPFPVTYENPDDTGYSPYPPAPAPRVRSRSLGRVPVLVGGIAAVTLVVAGLMAGIVALSSHSSHDVASAPPTVSSTPKAPSLSRPVDGADGLGFIGHPARCDAGNPPAAVVRTAKSLAVICQTGNGDFYYRGERIRDGANIQLANAVRTSDGFDVTNPANGVRYQVRPQQLTILSNGHVDSAEPVLQYATSN